MVSKILIFWIISLFFVWNTFTLKANTMVSGCMVETVLMPNTDSVGEWNCLNNRLLKVPADFPSIAKAVAYSKDGDRIIISPGTYFENEIVIDKAITISSEWKLTGDESVIEKTIIDCGEKILFTVNKDGVEVSGLTLINGDHTLNIEARVSIMHNHFLNNKDGMSFESNGGGYVAYNTAENDRDDALDVDIISDDKNSGSDLLVEHNVFLNSNDDGIEIRLFKPLTQDINYTIRQNQIFGSKNAGIQLISYDEFTGKVFKIHHNVFENCKTGLGCMEGAETREDLSGATKMDETVYFYNNTVVNCQMGATGGNRIIAFNNLILNNSVGGFKLFGANSVIRNNLFFNNGGNDLIAINPSVAQDGNVFEINPLLAVNTYAPAQNSPCVDGGISEISTEDGISLTVSQDYIAGKAPDIGAFEKGLRIQNVQIPVSIQADAGEDRVIESSSPTVFLTGRIRNDDGRKFNCGWNQVMGPEMVEIADSDRLVASTNLTRHGIYQFSLNCSDGLSMSSDRITIRFISKGEGKQLFLSGESTHLLDGEDFAYSYGNVKLKRNNGLRLDPSAQVEFSVGMAEPSEYELWLLIKAKNPGGNLIQVEFNQQAMGTISSINNKKFNWVKVPGKVKTTPGQWQLLIRNMKGTILLDKLILSKDANFMPH